MDIVELSWTEQLGGRYSLAVGYPEDFEPCRRDEIERVIHDAGLISEGNCRWTTPNDQNAPAAMWERFTVLGDGFAMDTAVLPPSLLLVIGGLQFV